MELDHRHNLGGSDLGAYWQGQRRDGESRHFGTFRTDTEEREANVARLREVTTRERKRRMGGKRESGNCDGKKKKKKNQSTTVPKVPKVTVLDVIDAAMILAKMGSSSK